ncbi:unnamed protein product [Owenia fusiformis]|uniref:Uncharacterized protein n=1 Tax=Owenia fusiformis TaxID=6347 RepID=A0A8J1UFE3_OWEFU|nr:unnamed protein product [Owenia fusiformis]
MYILALVTLMAASAVMADVPAFCNGYDCPRFKVLREMPDYEVREYEESRWVGTDVSGASFRQAGRSGFWRLFRYISGNNVANAKIPMTCPVLRTIFPKEVAGSEGKYTTLFFQPLNLQEIGGPAPSDPDVYLQVVPKVVMYVRSFGGYASEDDYLNEADILAASINNSSAYINDEYYAAGYDSPFKFWNRHNEILFKARDSQKD